MYLYGDMEKHGVSLKVVADLKEVASKATLRFGVGPYTNQSTISVAKDFSLLFFPLLLIVPFCFFRFVVLRCLGIINEGSVRNVAFTILHPLALLFVRVTGSCVCEVFPFFP